MLISGCAEEKKKLVVPVAGIAPDYKEQKAEQLRLLAADFPKLKQNAIDAIDSVARMIFVSAESRHRAYLIRTTVDENGTVHKKYDDKSLPIGSGQSMIRLSDLAFLLSELDIQPTDRVYEVGSGNGYMTAILSRLCAHVYGMEINENLLEIGVQRLQRMNFMESGSDGDGQKAEKKENIRICCGDGLPNELPQIDMSNVDLYRKMACRNDGLYGLVAYAPYDVMIVTAAVSLERPAFVNEGGSGKNLAEPGEPFTPEERLQTILTLLKPGGRIAVPIFDHNKKPVWKIYHWNDGKLHETASRPTNVKAAFVPDHSQREE